MDLHIARALKLFVNNVVHTATRIDQGGCYDRQTAAVFDISRRAEKSLREIQRNGIYATGQRLSAGRNDDVIRSRKPR